MRGTDGTAAARAPRRRLLASGLLLLAAGLLAAWAFGSFSAWAQEGPREVLADIRVVGNRTIGTEQVLRYMKKLRPGAEYTQAALLEDTERLSKARLFRSVRPREERTPDGQIIVIFEVQEFPNLVSDIVYQNLKTISSDEVEKMISLKRGMPLDPAANRRAAFEIQDYFKSKGRYFANVSLVEGDKPTDRRVVFNVMEGPIVRINAIRFTGNDFGSSGRLRTQLDSGIAVLKLLGGVFQPAIIENDVIKLEEYYKANGYLEARVTRQLDFSEDSKLVDITFHIAEGRRYQIKEVVVNTTRDKEEMSTIVQAKAGEWYSDRVVSADIASLQAYRGWRGHQTLVEKRLYTVPEEPGVVRVQYEVREQPPAKVGRVIIIGNDVTKDRVIRRVLGLLPGQTLRYPELRAAERDLARLNIFEVSPESKPTITVLESDSEYKDILVQVKETTTGSLLFGAGFNSDAGLVGSVVLNERNFDIFKFPRSFSEIFEGKAFRGAGQELRVEAVPGTELQRYSVSFREPFLFDRPYSLSLSGYYNDRVFPEYTEGRVGARVGLAHQFQDYRLRGWSVAGNLRVENIDVSNLPFFAPPDYQKVRGDNFLVGARAGVTYDTRDSFMRPTEGGLLELSYEQVFGDYTFPIINVEGSRYFTVTERADGSGKHVVAARTHIAWAGDDAPVFERFYAGGFRSMRGFEFRGMNPFEGSFAVGGNFMFLNSLEYQLPILANDQLYAVGFIDTGTVERDVEITNYRVSVGFGLRVTVPALGPVPIALDFGFPIVRAPQDRDQIFSFWVGMFR